MTYRDLPYYEGIWAKTRHEYKKSQKLFTYLYKMVHNLVPSGHSKYWLIRHSMASTAIYSLRDCSYVYAHVHTHLFKQETTCRFKFKLGRKY